jgi:general secretion pathway protein A
VDSSRFRRSLADDPDFQASLSELDRDLTSDDGGDEKPADPSSAPPVGSRRPLLDLFPPAAAPEPPRVPVRGVTPAPRLARASVRHAPPPVVREPDSLTYETFYGLAEKPFAVDPDPRFLYHSTAHDETVRELLEAIRLHAGVVLVTGVAGIGKTTLSRVVLDQLDRRTLTSFVAGPPASLGDLVQAVLVDFGVLSREELARRPQTDVGELTKTMRSFVASLAPLQAKAVVIVDEAQQLPAAVLQDLLQLIDGTASTLHIVLVGQPELLTHLSARELRMLHDRITARSELTGLVEDEIPGYVMHRLGVAGQHPRVDFDDPALRLLFELSRGNPRIVNELCDRALTRAFDISASVIDEKLIRLAADELGVSEPVGDTRLRVRSAIAVLVLLLLMVAGAAAAAWTFRDRLSDAIIGWASIPPPPPAPVFAVPKPFAPNAAIDDAFTK